MPRTQKRTNIYIVDEETWAWAQYRAKLLGYETTSEYLFDLVKLDHQKSLLQKRPDEMKRVTSNNGHE